ncbi:hypothetical protein [Pasteurella dagmatis]|uniref:Uncharacterized protein n=1 Tax=Pasteurella dagmatis ATCC 43325 TaxID=667128 RepID=C9PPY7_9PAST|nr:hypothetical protein [Pasteurella dagmatis]EEX50438.1 hypothetical protein HMPREF0621_1061 [Pasteurella dagmatis ATCC 43325]SNV56050.1 Uncharacterised protein [Pasteurella dagmatis]
MFINEETIYDVRGLDTKQKELAKAFIKGSVYAWLNCHNHGDEFSVRDLFGKDNADWTNTPLECIWEKNIKNSKNNDEAYEQSAKDVGWLLKAVLNEDTEYEFKKIKRRVNSYTGKKIN